MASASTPAPAKAPDPEQAHLQPEAKWRKFAVPALVVVLAAVILATITWKPASGLTVRRPSGNLLNQATLNLHCKRHQPLETIGCSDRLKVTWCRTHSLMVLQHNAPVGL